MLVPPGERQFLASCGESRQTVPGAWRNWHYWFAPTIVWDKSNRTPLLHYVFVHSKPPGCTSDFSMICPGLDLGGNTPGHHMWDDSTVCSLQADTKWMIVFLRAAEWQRAPLYHTSPTAVSLNALLNVMVLNCKWYYTLPRRPLSEVPTVSSNVPDGRLVN